MAQNKPMNTFKREMMMMIKDFPPGVILMENEKGGMNKNIVEKWFDKVCSKKKKKILFLSQKNFDIGFDKIPCE